MKKILSILLLSAFLIPLFCITPSAAGEKITLYVYNWGEYISDGSEGCLDTNAEFEAYCREELGLDVTVNYSTFSSCEDMYARVSSGAAAYDVIIPSDYMIQRMIKENLLLPLDMEKIPNYKYLSDVYKGENVYYEPQDGKTYSIPYLAGMVGVIYNTEYVDEKDPNLGSWSLMWSEDHSGDILQFNNSRDAFGTALYYLGYDVNEATEEQWREALELLKKQKNVVQGYVMDEIFNKMQSGSAAVAAYYAGDFLSMYENNDSLDFYYPKEGTNKYVDAMCIPYNAKHAELAEAYINFMCRPDIALANASYTYYASPLDLEALADDADYSDAYEEYMECMEEVRPGAYDLLYGDAASSVPTQAYLNLDDDKLMLLNELWEELKVESEIGQWIYILCAVILASLAALGIYQFLKKRAWAKLYD